MAKNGEIVGAVIDGESMVTCLFNQDGQIRLQPENSAMGPIYPTNLDMAGMVVSVDRAHKSGRLTERWFVCIKERG